MSVKEIEMAVNQAIRSEGYRVIPYSVVRPSLEEHAPELLDYHGFSFIGDDDADRVYINDADTDGERVFTELHEAAHLLTGSADEGTADRIATFVCRLIESLTGCRIDAEPLQDIAASPEF